MRQSFSGLRVIKFPLFLALIFGAFICSFAQDNKNPAEGTQIVSDSTVRRKVNELFEQGRFSEAVPHLEMLVKREPNDADLRFLYGFALLVKSKNVEEPELGMLLSSQALTELKKAKELGLDSKTQATVDKLIAVLTADSSNDDAPAFSKNAEANKLMVQAESFFGRSNYEKAFELYQKALAIDPTIYEAALFSGDVKLKDNDFDGAEMWYQKAITINPDRETAYRYSATPLMKQGKYDKALDRYIEAYITEPYNSRAIGGLSQWSNVTETPVGHPKFNIPKYTVNSQGKSETQITLPSLEDDGSMAWISYTTTRTEWRDSKFKSTFPNEKSYRHTLAEEAAALRAVISMVKELKPKKKNAGLEMLRKIDEEGLLESYILLAIADDGIRQDHPAYLKQNRDKLRTYVKKYVIKK